MDQCDPDWTIWCALAFNGVSNVIMGRTFYGVHDRSLTLNNRNSYDSFQTQIRTNGGYFIGCGFAALNNRRSSLEEQKNQSGCYWLRWSIESGYPEFYQGLQDVGLGSRFCCFG